ncbi:alanine racemase [Naumannella halotolerans]|uniref:alanine racemase n=1 Tax=Naumannella halotolerans TaxID=993414 RepID=UPI001414E787|nr:alanine racemase [Naumannella halotolerans]
MTGTMLRVDRAGWEAGIDAVAGATPGLVPVAKGNGYGFGLTNLAEQTTRMGADTIAVGTVFEIDPVREAFDGDIVVLTPWSEDFPATDPRVIPTVSRLGDLARLAAAGERRRVLVEVQTSMRRHGILPAELNVAAGYLRALDFAGWVIHLPLSGAAADEALGLAGTATNAHPGPLWLSHVTAAEAERIGERTGQPTRLRLGTKLWLGAPTTYGATSVVLDVHRVGKGERVGYRQKKAPGNGHLVVVAGGTAHGIALEAPTPAATWRQRATAVATGVTAASGRALSPFSIGGAKRRFIEPPHMQSSLVFVPAEVRPPQVGDEIGVTVRNTTYLPDEIVFD